MSKVEAKQAIGAAIKAGLDATDGEWRSDRVKRETAIRTALFHLGFTREDVTELRRAADRIDNEWGVEIGDVPQAVALRLIADRVEALLPSETGWTLVKGAEHVSGSAGGSFSATSDEPKPALPPTEDQSK